MSDNPIIHLLVVDRSPSDIESIAQNLREAGYVVDLLNSDHEMEILSFIKYKPIDIIMVRIGEQLPTLQAVRDQVSAAEKDIPIVAIIDAQTQDKPVALLQAGADNFFDLNEPDHPVIAVKKELNHQITRQQAHSLERQFNETEARSRALLDSSRDAIAYVHEGVHIYANPAYLRLFGYASEEDLEGVPFINMAIRDDRDALKSFLRRSTKKGQSLDPIQLTGLSNNEETFPITINCVPTRMDGEPCLQIVIRSSEEKENQQKLVEYSTHDELTGLYNRKAITQHLHELCRSVEKASGAMLYILLSDYRTISERLGLIAIDQLLRDLAKLIQQSVSDKEIVARLYDAVIVIYTPETDQQAVLRLGEKLSDAVKEHSSHAAKSLINTNSSIGIYTIQDNDDSETQILFRADRACEAARQKGPNKIQLYRPPSDEANQEEGAELVGMLRDAISGDRLSLLFQPIASFQDGSEERYKAYLRILDDKQMPLSIQTLGPVAETRNLMQPLDKWVIVRGLETLTERYQETKKTPTLFIRISSNSLTEKNFYSWLEQRLQDTGLSGSALVIEVKEVSAEQYFNEAQVLRERLRALGCGFALSHFGGKDHSERLFQELAPDYIKLDSTLIEKLAKDEASRQSMSTLIDQAQSMDTRIVATGIATAPQMASIYQFGITLLQGDMVQEPDTQLDFDFQQFAE